EDAGREAESYRRAIVEAALPGRGAEALGRDLAQVAAGRKDRNPLDLQPLEVVNADRITDVLQAARDGGDRGTVERAMSAAMAKDPAFLGKMWATLAKDPARLAWANHMLEGTMYHRPREDVSEFDGTIADMEDGRTLSVDVEADSGAPPAPGTLINRFLVVEELGRGGMGLVLSAYDPQLDRRVALKLLRDADGLRAATELAREAQAMARLQHPNVVAVHEVGEVNGTPYVVMEQVAGLTFRDWLAAAPRGWRAIVDLLVGAGEGLAAAHRAGIVHRDFKPENVLVDADGRPRVADFGLAALARARPIAGGTLGYMAPEQRAGESIDERADQYAFCTTAWEALQGERPAADPAPPRARRAPASVYRALARGLRTRRDERWPSMAALLGAVRPPASRRRWLWIGGAAAFGVVAFAVGRHEAAAPRCDDGAARIAAVWDGAARDRVAGAFRRTGRPNADDTFVRVDAALRARSDAWARLHRDVCEATYVRHEQSDALLDLRMRCLDQARSELGALAAALAGSDGAALDRAPQAAANAGDLAACSDAATLVAGVPPPRDPAAIAGVEAVREQLARLTALRALGQWKEGLALAGAT